MGNDLLPDAYRDAQRSCFLRVKLRRTRQGKGIALTGHTVHGRKGRTPGSLRPGPAETFHGKAPGLGHGQEPYLIVLHCGQTQNRRQCVLQTFRPGDRQRLCAPKAAHGLKQTGQAENMVPVVVAQGDKVDLQRAEFLPAQGRLGAFAAVKEYAAPGAAKYRGADAALRRGHGRSAAQQGDVDHCSALFPVNNGGGKGFRTLFTLKILYNGQCKFDSRA